MMNIAQAVLTKHAVLRLAKRQLTESDVRQVLATPEQIEEVRPGRVVAQGLVSGYLLRVFVDVDRFPAEIVTACRTSKIEKYRVQP
jgi:hypothetical protein